MVDGLSHLRDDPMILPAKAVRLEREMLPALRKSLRSALSVERCGWLSVLQEPTIGTVIPDLLVGIWESNPSTALRERFTLVETHILALLETAGRLKPGDVRARLFLSEVGLQRALRRLAKVGAIREHEDGLLSIVDSARTDGVTIIAVEAKMRRWKEALEQAKAYTSFADKAFVLLDGNQVRTNVRILDAFRTSGVGLLMLYNPLVRLVIDCEARPVASADRVRAADKLHHVATAMGAASSVG